MTRLSLYPPFGVSYVLLFPLHLQLFLCVSQSLPLEMFSRCVAAFCGWSCSAVCVCVCVCVCADQCCLHWMFAGWFVIKTALCVHHFVSRFSEVQNRREPFHEALRSWQPLWGRWVTVSLQMCYKNKGTLLTSVPSSDDYRISVWDLQFLITAGTIWTHFLVFFFTKYHSFLVTFNLYLTKKSFELRYVMFWSFSVINYSWHTSK